MLIKSIDDKSKRLALLEELLQSPLLNSEQKNWAQKELHRLRTGIQGERDAAHYIDAFFGGGENHAVLHDLRLCFDDEVAQIDHLIISRGMVFYLLETKSFGGDVAVNEYGEFSVKYPGRPAYGIPSPFEQSRRQEQVLRKLLQKLEVTGRVGMDPKFEHIVLIHPRATISRPSSDKFDTSHIIKADQFKSWHEKYVNAMSTFDVMGSLFNFRSQEALREIAEKIARQHRPMDLLTLPEFMRPKATEQIRHVRQDTSSAVCANSNAEDQLPKKRLVCATCGAKISYDEGKFCWNQPQRFGGLQYCREHQKAFRA